MKTYSEKLTDPMWQKKRLEIMQRDEFQCQFCGDDKSELNVHHKRYIDGKLPHEYENEDLITYCKDCHTVIHYVEKCYTLPESEIEGNGGIGYLIPENSLMTRNTLKYLKHTDYYLFFELINGNISKEIVIPNNVITRCAERIKLGETLNECAKILKKAENETKIS